MTNKPDSMPIAVRVFSEPATPKQRDGKAPKIWSRPPALFVFDTETTSDALQRLIFGSYRYVVEGRCLEEGLFCAGDLSAQDRLVLEAYVSKNHVDTARRTKRQLPLLTRAEFLKRLYKSVYKRRCLLVGFNLPFDLSRIAFDVTNARGRFAGGFSLGVWSYINNGLEYRNQFRPRIAIKHIDSKRALKGFTARNSPDGVDLIPRGPKLVTQNGEIPFGVIFLTCARWPLH